MIKIRYRLTLTQRNGPTTRTPWRDCHSWTRQFMKVLRVHLAMDDDPDVWDQGGASRTIVEDSALSEMDVKGNAGEVNRGPCVGYGDAAESPTDYRLEFEFAHGTGAPEISYGATTVSAATIDGSDIYVDVYRGLTNNGSGNRFVSEIGLACITQTRVLLLIRDVLTSPIAVPEGATLTLTYRILTSN